MTITTNSELRSLADALRRTRRVFVNEGIDEARLAAFATLRVLGVTPVRAQQMLSDCNGLTWALVGFLEEEARP